MHPSELVTDGDVAVIGAGLAGLAAARELSSAGLTVRVFDKGRGAGGRTAARRTPEFTFDHGAQYFTVRRPRFAGLVDEATRAGAVARWNGSIVALGRDGVRSTSNQTERFVGTPTMSALARHLARDLDVRQGVCVDAVERNGEGLFPFSEGIPLGRYRALVCTVPTGQVEPLLGDLTPLARRAAETPMQPCWAVMVGFDRRLDLAFDGAFVEDSPLTWVARNSSKPGRPPAEAWVLHAAPEWTLDHWNADPGRVIEWLLGELGERARLELPNPVHAVAHRWRYALPAPPLEVGALHERETGIVLAGDWCAGARVEGAVISGWAAAEHLLADDRLRE